MPDDIRYSELRFLQSLPSGTSEIFNHHDPKNWETLGLNPTIFIELVLTMIEEMYVAIDNQAAQWLVGKLRGENTMPPPSSMGKYQWDNPRETLTTFFIG